MDNPLRMLVGVLTRVSEGISRIKVLVVYPVAINLPLSKLHPRIYKRFYKGVSTCVVRVPEPFNHPVITDGVQRVVIREVLGAYPNHITVKVLQEVLDILVLVVQHDELVTVYEQEPVKILLILLVELCVCQGLYLVNTAVVLVDDRRVIYDAREQEVVVVVGEDDFIKT